MNRRNFLAVSTAAAALGGCASLGSPAGAAGSAAASPATDNPLLKPWTGPYGGVPAFDKIKVENFVPAVNDGITWAKADIGKIANNMAAPTFENTIAALDDSGRPLTRAALIYGVYSSTMDDKPMQAVDQTVGPIFAAFQDETTQNAQLFQRIKTVYEAREHSNLTPEQQRLTWLTYNRFARQGAGADAAGKKRLGEINQRLATLFTTFTQNQLGDEEAYSVTLERADLAGLPEDIIAGAAAAAKDKGQEGKWLITNTRSSAEPFLTYSSNRALREKVFRMWSSRGDNGDARDNNKIIPEILKLRAERAKILGFATHAHWITANQMAKTPEAAMDLMLRVWAPAKARVREEVADMQAIADKEGANITIAAWDYRYYAEKVRLAKYDLDQNEVKQYLQLEKIREAMHWAAGELYGFTFTQIHDVPVVHPDVRVWEVKRAGQHVGLWYFDPYARAGKQSGAWMNEYRTQENFRGRVTPIVSNNCNFVKGAAGQPVLISWDDASTMFHEFGHGLHGLNSNVHYVGLAGANTAGDFIEMPSQLNERWLPTKEVLGRFALHYQTGKPIPDSLVAKIKNADKFNQGFITVEYLASALIDMKLHLAGDATIDPKAFERDTLAELGMPKEIIMRHRMPHFGHIFAGDGYSAGYYDYIWADTHSADAAEAFAEAPGGFYDKPTAKRLHDTIMSVGNSVDAGDAFKAFRGRAVNVDALMRDRGFPTA